MSSKQSVRLIGNSQADQSSVKVTRSNVVYWQALQGNHLSLMCNLIWTSPILVSWIIKRFLYRSNSSRSLHDEYTKTNHGQRRRRRRDRQSELQSSSYKYRLLFVLALVFLESFNRCQSSIAPIILVCRYRRWSSRFEGEISLQEPARRQTPLFVHRSDYHGYPAISLASFNSQWHMRVHHGTFPVLQRTFSSLAKFHSAQFEFERLFSEDSSFTRQSR